MVKFDNLRDNDELPRHLRQIVRSKKESFVKRIFVWSKKNSPNYSWRKTSNPYLILIAELLLRRTRAENVENVYLDFVKKYPDISTLSRSSINEIADTIRPLGIVSRCYKLKSIAKQIVKDHDGVIPAREDELMRIIGIRSYYTTNAIRCFAMNARVPIFDINVKRILERVFSLDFGNSPHKKKFSWEIVKLLLPTSDIKQYNWAIIDLGKSICVNKNPRCKICPLKAICDYASLHLET